MHGGIPIQTELKHICACKVLKVYALMCLYSEDYHFLLISLFSMCTHDSHRCFLSHIQTDRLNSKRQTKIGTIEVVRYEASYVKEEYRPLRDTDFDQANKKDTYKVTDGKYTMSTTKKGRYINRTRPYDVQLKKLWRIGNECGRLTVNYRMGHTLQEMNIQLRPIDWSRVVVKRRASAQSSSPTVSPTASPTSSPPPIQHSVIAIPEPEDIKPQIALLSVANS